MNFPPGYRSLSEYRATLGHYVNHSFKKTNAEFSSVFHPRFGNVMAVSKNYCATQR
jgi:hypothetical protein